MKPVMGKNERNAENLVHKQQQKRKRNYKPASKETTDDIPTRAIRSDGHYFVCTKCDNGGKLLCCDSCACTFHLQCLDPPLYSTPKGYWQCPNCDHDDRSEPIANHKRLASGKWFSINEEEEDASYTCSLCANTNKIVVLSEEESDQPKSPEFNSEEANLPTKNQEGTSVCNTDSCETSTQKSPNNNEKTNVVPHSPAQHKEASLALKDKYAELRTRQKERLCIEVLSNLESMAQKRSSDQQAFRYKESAPLHASPYRWGGARDLLSSMSLGGQQIPISNTSLLSMFSSTAMGGPLSFEAGTSSDANADAMAVIPTPRGLLKWKAPIISWSEEELDALWVGVRRYGVGNWDAILGDPSLNCLKNKTLEDLSARWNNELPKLFDPAPISSMPIRPEPPPNANSDAMGFSFFCAPQWSASSNREPVNGELLLGGHFPLPKHAPPDNVIVDDDNYDTDLDDGDDTEKSES